MRHYKQLTKEQRKVLQSLLNCNVDKKKIAKELKVHISTVYREIKRNSNKRTYSCDVAEKRSQQRKQRLHRPRKFTNRMKREISVLIAEYQFSPEEIKGMFDLTEKPCVSVVSIYKFIHQDKDCGGRLWKYCRHKLKRRKRTSYKQKGMVANRKNIKERPSEADGKRFGDWEMDTIVGEHNHGAMLTLVERSTNFMMIRLLPFGKNAKELAKVVIDCLLPYKEHVRTITTDNGLEFACHEMIAERINTDIYFADPYSSWQKGAIENTNKLVRQYIPKSSDFAQYTKEQIKTVQYALNRRPRKKLGYHTPKECFFKNIV